MKKIEEILNTLQIPYRYDHFTQKEMNDIPLPICVYLVKKDKNFFADGIVYKPGSTLLIELYTDQKDWDLEEKLETVLTEHGLAWSQVGSAWIKEENMWMAQYKTTI